MKSDKDEGVEITVGRWLKIHARGWKVILALVLVVLVMRGVPISDVAEALGSIR